GIFKSVRFDKLRSFYKMVGFKSNADLLLDILHGKVESSTGYDYRGKGLPAIYQQFVRGGLQALVFVANDVYANIGRNEYRTLPEPFNGTVIYWEV
ncbi:MAG: hypothetical protein M3N41_05535, partial [Acidobacteriota bacterium]|nr:hypothetical protein [Acidobacteriota bacterium]